MKNLREIFLTEALPTKAGGFYFLVSTTPLNKVIGAKKASGTMTYTRAQTKQANRAWGYLNLCDAQGQPLPAWAPDVQEILELCSEVSSTDGDGNTTTRYIGDGSKLEAYRLNTAAPITRKGVFTGGYWCQAHQEVAPVAEEPTAPVLKPLAQLNKTALQALCEVNQLATADEETGRDLTCPQMRVALKAAGVTHGPQS